MEEVYEIGNYLPFYDVEVSDYVKPLFDSAIATFEKEQFQFSYFAIHLIFMTYIYSAVWKIGQFHKEKYEHSLLFVRPYRGKENKVDFKQVKSIFEYSLLPEKDIFEFFRLIELDNGYIQSTKKLIEDRNDMAHATGKIKISSSADYFNAIKDILSVIYQIHKRLTFTLRNWYHDELLTYAKNGLNEEYDSINDYLESVFFDDYHLSRNEFLACKEYGVSRFSDRDKFNLSVEEIQRIKEFHETVKIKYADIAGEEYIQEKVI